MQGGTDFRETDADVLGAWVVREMITRCHRWNLPLETIDCVLGSNVATPTHAVNPTRVAAVTGGLPATIPADTVAGKNCGSGVTALYYASLRIRSGDADTVLVIGMEAMSRIPVVYHSIVANPSSCNTVKPEAFGNVPPVLWPSYPRSLTSRNIPRASGW